MSLSSDVIRALTGKTLATAESCTGGGIGAALTAVPGSSAVFVGGVISYTDQIKQEILGVSSDILSVHGAVSRQTAAEMVRGARNLLKADVAVSVTGLAGPGGDDRGNPVGTVYIGYEDAKQASVHHFCFSGDRDAVRSQAVEEALRLILKFNS